MLTVWQDLHSKAPSDAEEYTSEILWNNRFIKIDGRPIYYASWYENGVTTIGDLLDENKKFLTYKSLLDKFDLRTNFLTYNGVIATIANSWKESFQRRSIALQNVKTTRNNLSVTNITAKKSRIVLANDAFIPPNVEFNLINMHRNPTLTYKLPFNVTTENRLRCSQYKVINNILPTNDILYKMKIKPDPMCKYCESTRETLTHMLFECPKVKQFWLKVIDWWNKKRVDDATVTSSDILYGYKPESTSTYTFNHFLLIVKFFIFQAKQANPPPPPPVFRGLLYLPQC